MKRSEINRAIETAKQVFIKLNIPLPPFAFWTVDDWNNKGAEADEVRKAMLGWDVTDFGQDNFQEIGRTLFTLRNGHQSGSGFSKVYAEKLILDPPNQKPPLHYHRSKMEDIIVRGGGNVMIQLFNASRNEQPSDKTVSIQIDAQTHALASGAIVRLEPGQSVCIPPYISHQFWGEEGTGVEVDGVQYAVSGEVSSVCDDWNDNCFLETCERFPQIEEDEPPRHYL
ncbi:D-lyxose/D-mannose family sugar isomerase, partial [candidate division KSB3 bacterium]|nr:D-lyxose/D-mannose family sugar isomerase [candidate division KSB3 bacterium]